MMIDACVKFGKERKGKQREGTKESGLKENTEY